MPSGEPIEYYMSVASGGWWPYGSLSTSTSTCPNCGGTCFSTRAHHCPTAVGIPSVWVSPQPERKPHVCPVCTGSGDVDDTQQADTALRAKQCPACKGACVLWG